MQICAIFEYLKNGDNSKRGWCYVGDTRGEDNYNFANDTLKMGDEVGSSGVGDCDDFAILLSSLIESIGGTTRVIRAYNQTNLEGHAYTEVYLGKIGDRDDQIETILDWLKRKYKTETIYFHIEPETKEVWLNLDWSAEHPGGPFFPGDKHSVLLIRKDINRTSLNAYRGFMPSHIFTNFSSSIWSIDISPDDNNIVVGCSDGTIKLLEINTGKEIWAINEDFTNDVSFSPNGDIIASAGGSTKAVHLWDTHNGKLIRTLLGHSDFVSSVAFSPNGTILASGGWDKSIILWNVHTGQKLSTLNVSGSTLLVAFTPDGRIIATGTWNNNLDLFNLQDRNNRTKYHRILTGHSAPITRFSISSDSRIMAGGSGEIIKLWDVHKGMEIRSLMGHSSVVHCVAFSPDDKNLVSGSADKTIRLWNVTQGSCIDILSGHSSDVEDIAFSSDGKILVSCGLDSKVIVWN